VTKAKALNGFGMKTSVTSPNLAKYSRKSSAEISSVQLHPQKKKNQSRI